jgi:hypothetical protein
LLDKKFEVNKAARQILSHFWYRLQSYLKSLLLFNEKS